LKRGLSSSPCKRSEEVGCPSLSPISLVELGRSVVIISKNRLDEGVFKEGLSIPLEAFHPLTPFSVKRGKRPSDLLRGVGDF